MRYTWIALIILVSAPIAFAANLDKSDINGDGVVDVQDLESFSTRYLEQEWQSVDACAFYASSILNPKYFRRVAHDSVKHYDELLNYAAASEGCATVTAAKSDKSDLNDDGVVDLDDLVLFSINNLEQSWESVDWCMFHGAVLAGAEFEGESTSYYAKHFGSLLNFINVYFNCGGEPPPPDNLAVENSPIFLARIANGTSVNGNYYLSDPRVGSVFIYDEFLTLTGELKGLNKPLGVAVDLQGNILVGNNGRDNIEVYDSGTGDLIAVFGQGVVHMPTSITFDLVGNIYVTDSKRHDVKVFDSAFNLIRTIGQAGIGDKTLKFPTDTEIIGQEIFIADQGYFRVQVFDLNGQWLRTISFEGTEGQNCNWFTGVCEIPGMPPFTRLQALSSDDQGRLHVLDSFAAAVVIFDPADGSMLNSYGEYGSAPGQLRVPMDVQVPSSGLAVVTSGDGDRIETFSVPQ